MGDNLEAPARSNDAVPEAPSSDRFISQPTSAQEGASYNDAVSRMRNGINNDSEAKKEILGDFGLFGDFSGAGSTTDSTHPQHLQM